MRDALFLSGLMLVIFLAGGFMPSRSAELSSGDQKPTVSMLFNGMDLKGWKLKGSEKQSRWVVGTCTLDSKMPGQLSVTPLPPKAEGSKAAGLLINDINAKGRGKYINTSVDIYTEEKFGDARIEVEFMIPEGSNSGIYVMGEYEVQILDSFGSKKKPGPGDLGGIYQMASPLVDAAKAPGEWQRFVIEIQAPRFENGKKVSNAKFLKVTLNDQVIHEDVEMTKGPTPTGVTGKEAPTGPLMIQGNHGPVAFRRIAITPMNYK